MPSNSITRIIGYIQKRDFQIHYLHSNVMEALHKKKKKNHNRYHAYKPPYHTFRLRNGPSHLDELQDNKRCRSFSPFPSNIWLGPRCQKQHRHSFIVLQVDGPLWASNHAKGRLTIVSHSFTGDLYTCIELKLVSQRSCFKSTFLPAD